MKPINWVLAIGAGLLYAIALRYFVIPAEVIPTGTEGIAVSLSYFFESPVLFIVLYTLMQSVLIVFAVRRISGAFALRTLVVVSSVVISLLVLPEFEIVQPGAANERIMLVLFGGILAGCAKAIAFRDRGSTGDEDIVAAYLAMKYLRPVGSIAIIAGAVSTVFGLALAFLKSGDLAAVINTLMYTALYLWVSTETLNNLYHKFKLTMLSVVHEDTDAVAAAVREVAAHRTYTLQPGVGGFDGRSRSTLRTVVTLEELPALLDAIERAAPDAFYYHHELEGVSRRFYISPVG